MQNLKVFSFFFSLCCPPSLILCPALTAAARQRIAEAWLEVGADSDVQMFNGDLNEIYGTNDFPTTGDEDEGWEDEDIIVAACSGHTALTE